MTNPFTSNKKIITTYALMWFFLFVAQLCVIYFALNTGFYPALVDSIVFNLVYMVLGIGIWYTVRFNSLENYSAPKILLNHIVAATISAGLWIGVSELVISSILGSDQKYLDFLYNSTIWRFLFGILIYIVLVAVDYVIIYYNNFQEKVLKESELNALIKEAELNALKYQINPHFIFNSLNSISSLTLSNPLRAQEMTIKLSSFMRNTLAKNERQKSRLLDEINAGKLYLDIEKVRFEDKFDFIEDVKPECKEMEVPSMILQPLFENAIKHGVYESLEKVIIKLYCQMEKEYFRITVENNFDPESLPRKGSGIGLKNIQNRMKLIYNQDNLVQVEKKGNIFRINIYIPVGN